MGRALRGSFLLAAVCWLLAGCGSTTTSTHRLPAYETPIARTDYQNVRTTAYTDTEADHLAYTHHNALGGILHAASTPLLPAGTAVAAVGPVPEDADEAAETIGGVRRVSNDVAVAPRLTAVPTVRSSVVPAARPVKAIRPIASAARPPASDAEGGDNPPWMKEYLRRKQQQQQQSSNSRQTFYVTPATPAVYSAPVVYGSAAADWSRWPVGTVFRIESTGQLYRVDDYGWALAGRNTIDLYHSSRSAMNAWGVRHVPIHVLHWGSREESLRLLVRHQGYKHIRRMVLELEGHDHAAAELE